MAQILLIDDDEDIAHCLKDDLVEVGHHVECLDCTARGPEVLREGNFDLVLLDYRMPRQNGIEFLADLRKQGINIPVILMTGHGTPDTAIQARKLGARAYFLKPMDGQLFRALEPLIDQMLETSRKMKERVHLPSAGTPPPSATTLVGNSPAMQKVYERIGQIAESNASVLILGETGSGKEMIARALYQYSDRSDKPFVAVNSTAIPEALLESEMFGHEKGAFTGADRRRIGKFEQADGGTILLDEIGDMSLATQAKILRVLQEGELVRLGDSPVIKIDVRVIACTHRNLPEAMRCKQFRDDLYYRLSQVTLRLPTLRERGPEDLRLLATHFLAQVTHGTPRSGLTFHPDTLEKLCDNPWTGNVRQLKNAIWSASLFATGAQIMPADLEIDTSNPEDARSDTALAENKRPKEEDARAGLRTAIRWAWNENKSDLWPLLRDLLEKELLAGSLARGHNHSQLADRLGIARTTLWKRLRELGLEFPSP